jgi:aryl-alcohol dehydrogenase-like predicted oxidoreductase
MMWMIQFGTYSRRCGADRAHHVMTLLDTCHSIRDTPRRRSVLYTRRLGTSGPEVSAIGLGCMGMSDFYGPADEGESVATIHAALDAGITLLDTGDFYGTGHNENLLRRALADGKRAGVILSVKFGVLRAPGGGFGGVDGRPAAVKSFLAYSLQRLGTDHVDVYRPARVDPSVPIEETVGAIADLVKAGWVRYLGLSEASAETVRRAHAIHPVTDLQIEYSIVSRSPEASIRPALAELGIGMTAYGLLSRGLLSDGPASGQSLGGFRAHLPRFQGDNLVRNLALVDRLRSLAAEKGATVAQLALAWGLARGQDVVPLVGARRRDRLAEALGALDLTLTAEDLARIDAVAPPGTVAGTRYGAEQMSWLDSERAPGL